MALTIDASTLLERRTLYVKKACVKIVGFGFLGTKKIPFSAIDAVLMAEDNVLSLQSGNRVFGFLTKPGKQGHKKAIAALLAGVRVAADGTEGG